MSEDKVAPDAQEFVGASEAAEIMDVQLSTFSHLRRREMKDGTSKFPEPVATLRCGPIWKTRDIKRFAAKYTAPRPGPKPAAPVKATKASVTKLPVKKTTAKAAAKAVAATNGEAEAKANGETPTQRKRVPRKVAAAKKIPATV